MDSLKSELGQESILKELETYIEKLVDPECGRERRKTGAPPDGSGKEALRMKNSARQRN